MRSERASHPPQLVYHLIPYNCVHNTYWSPEEYTHLQFANQMTQGDPSAVGAPGRTDGGYQCRWHAGGVAPCGEVFAKFNDLIDHLGCTHDMRGPAARPLVCHWLFVNGIRCGGQYRRDGMRRHIGIHVQLSVSCPDCDTSFSREDSMHAHRKKFHGKK